MRKIKSIGWKVGWRIIYSVYKRLEVTGLAHKGNVGSISQFMWNTAVLRIGQLASEMRVSMGGQSIGGSNDNADELTNWDGTKKKGLGW